MPLTSESESYRAADAEALHAELVHHLTTRASGSASRRTSTCSCAGASSSGTAQLGASS